MFCPPGSPHPHAGKPTKVARGPLQGATAHSEFKRLDEPARQRSACCSSGTSSCQRGSPSRAASRAGGVGGPVMGSPRWARIRSMTGLSSMKAMTLLCAAAPPSGPRETLLGSRACGGEARVDRTTLIRLLPHRPFHRR
jgi:hypothetical protein